MIKIIHDIGLDVHKNSVARDRGRAGGWETKDAYLRHLPSILRSGTAMDDRSVDDSERRWKGSGSRLTLSAAAGAKRGESVEEKRGSDFAATLSRAMPDGPCVSRGRLYFDQHIYAGFGR
jgi:hypothetical protein